MIHNCVLQNWKTGIRCALTWMGCLHTLTRVTVKPEVFMVGIVVVIPYNARSFWYTFPHVKNNVKFIIDWHSIPRYSEFILQVNFEFPYRLERLIGCTKSIACHSFFIGMMLIPLYYSVVWSATKALAVDFEHGTSVKYSTLYQIKIH